MRRVALAVLGTIAGLVGLLTFKTHPASVGAVPAAVGTSGAGTTDGGTTAAPATAAGSTGASTNTVTTTRTMTGDSVDTRWGPVQVRITVTSGRITGATAIEYPQGNGRDQEINAVAVPQLERESIGKTTSTIDMVSGATYTSTGYIRSLQSALDKL